jgi:hypothetical protein
MIRPATRHPPSDRHPSSAVATQRVQWVKRILAALLGGGFLTLGSIACGFVSSYANSKTAAYPFSRRLTPDALIFALPDRSIVWRLEHALGYSTFEAGGVANYFGMPALHALPDGRAVPPPPSWAGLSAIPHLGTNTAMRTSAVGLPLRCCIAVVEILPGDRPVVRLGRDPSRDPWPWARNSSLVAIDQIVAPTHVLWAPLFLNLTCWTLTSAVLLSTPLFVRRFHATIRRRRGHCISCGYDVRGLPRCPECGSQAQLPRTPAM